MNRRAVLTLLGGTAASWPATARGDDTERMRHVGVLTDYAKSDPQGRERIATFRLGMEQMGWVEGRNLHIDYCWGDADLGRIRDCGSELVRLAPDVIWANGTPPMQAARYATDTIPIIFANVADPIATGMVKSLVSPGGNVSGFANFEYDIAGKWLEILREITPGLRRFLFIHNAESGAARGLAEAMLGAGRAMGGQITISAVRDATDIERSIEAFGRDGGGLVVQPDGSLGGHRELIVSLAHKYRLPAVYPFRYYAQSGGLISYGVDLSDIIRRSAQYVDRVLKGAKPAELPVQFPTKYELVINLKTARALGITVPPTLLARADEVVE